MFEALMCVPVTGFDIEDLADLLAEARRAREAEEWQEQCRAIAETRVAVLEVLVREYADLWPCSATACDIGPDCLVCRSLAAMGEP